MIRRASRREPYVVHVVYVHIRNGYVTDRPRARMLTSCAPDVDNLQWGLGWLDSTNSMVLFVPCRIVTQGKTATSCVQLLYQHRVTSRFSTESLKFWPETYCQIVYLAVAKSLSDKDLRKWLQQIILTRPLLYIKTPLVSLFSFTYATKYGNTMLFTI